MLKHENLFFLTPLIKNETENEHNMGRLWRCWKKKWCYLRERADTLGRISYVPDFDVSSGNSEDETRGVPEMKQQKKGKQAEFNIHQKHFHTCTI